MMAHFMHEKFYIIQNILMKVGMSIEKCMQILHMKKYVSLIINTDRDVGIYD